MHSFSAAVAATPSLLSRRSRAQAMTQVVPISILALQAEDYSPDDKNVIISLVTKYSAMERKYSVPIECFFDFITDMKRLNALKAATPTAISSEADRNGTTSRTAA
jgi:hypothetical protein